MSAPRRATIDDIPHLVALAKRSYPQFALPGAEGWAGKILAMPQAAIFVHGDAVATVAIQAEFWNPEAKVADILPMYGEPTAENRLGVYSCLKAAIEWAKEQGCYGVRFGSSLGASGRRSRSDATLMEPFAKRLGAQLWGVTYMVEF